MLISLSFDLDWVPDIIIKDIVNILKIYNVSATFFMTNPVKIDLPENIEKAIHPNFLPSSTQGESEDAVLKYCNEYVSSFHGSRSHRLYWHSGLDLKLYEYGCIYDSSIFLPLQSNIRPFIEQKLVRIPFYWGDNFHLRNKFNLNKFELPNLTSDGIKVFQFHPINIYLNTHDSKYLQSIKKNIHPLHKQNSETLKRYIQNNRKGIRNFFLKFLEFISRNQIKTLTLVELARNHTINNNEKY